MLYLILLIPVFLFLEKYQTKPRSKWIKNTKIKKACSYLFIFLIGWLSTTTLKVPQSYSGYKTHEHIMIPERLQSVKTWMDPYLNLPQSEYLKIGDSMLTAKNGFGMDRVIIFVVANQSNTHVIAHTNANLKNNHSGYIQVGETVTWRKTKHKLMAPYSLAWNEQEGIKSLFHSYDKKKFTKPFFSTTYTGSLNLQYFKSFQNNPTIEYIYGNPNYKVNSGRVYLIPYSSREKMIPYSPLEFASLIHPGWSYQLTCFGNHISNSIYQGQRDSESTQTLANFPLPFYLNSFEWIILLLSLAFFIFILNQSIGFSLYLCSLLLLSITFTRDHFYVQHTIDKISKIKHKLPIRQNINGTSVLKYAHENIENSPHNLIDNKVYANSSSLSLLSSTTQLRFGRQKLQEELKVFLNKKTSTPALQEASSIIHELQDLNINSNSLDLNYFNYGDLIQTSLLHNGHKINIYTIFSEVYNRENHGGYRSYLSPFRYIIMQKALNLNQDLRETKNYLFFPRTFHLEEVKLNNISAHELETTLKQKYTEVNYQLKSSYHIP